MARSGEKKERQKARKLERGVTVSRHSSPTRSVRDYFFQGTQRVNSFHGGGGGGISLLWLVTIKTELALKCVINTKKKKKQKNLTYRSVYIILIAKTSSYVI